MSDTPLTDALLLIINEGRVYEDDGPLADHARQLERELAAADARLEMDTDDEKTIARLKREVKQVHEDARTARRDGMLEAARICDDESRRLFKDGSAYASYGAKACYDLIRAAAAAAAEQNALNSLQQPQEQKAKVSGSVTAPAVAAPLRAWIATHENGEVLHFSRHNGWVVDTVITEPNAAGQDGDTREIAPPAAPASPAALSEAVKLAQECVDYERRYGIGGHLSYREVALARAVLGRIEYVSARPCPKCSRRPVGDFSCAAEPCGLADRPGYSS